MAELFDQVKEFYQSDNPWAEVLRDVLAVAKILIVFAIISQLVFGMWTPMRAIESGSMEPHMKVGDIVFIQDLSRTSIVTYQDGAADDYKSFGEFGNVILYRKYGRYDTTPIIHRAMYYVEAGEPMWERGPPASHAGYITKGDHNKHNDQYSGVCREPIREEWVIGVSRFRVPYAGYVRLAFSEIIQMLKGEPPNSGSGNEHP
jgi:signal peptidase